MPSHSLLSLTVRSAYNVHKGYVVAKLQEERRIALCKHRTVINTNLTYLFGNETGERADTEKIVITCGRLLLAFSTTTPVMLACMEQHDTHHTDFRKKSYLGY